MDGYTNFVSHVQTHYLIGSKKLIINIGVTKVLGFVDKKG